MTLPRPIAGLSLRQDGPLVDPFGRVHQYLRVSVTDRCNYRCTYCMPAKGLDWMPRDNLLGYEEIERVVRVFVGLGVTRLRLTGGEPTVRKGIIELVARLGAIAGLEDLAMTTNGHRFGPMAAALREAGLKRVNISLDTLDPAGFEAITRGGDLAKVLGAVDRALEVGLVPVKINAVIVKGVNDDQIEPLVRHFAPLAGRVQLRFIEYMPFDGNDREKHHVAADEIRQSLAEIHGWEPLSERQGGGPAVHGRLVDSGLVVGFISPITEHFCDLCNRVRLTADGHLRTCLSREDTPSLRDLLRGGIDDEALARAIRGAVWAKVPGHEAHELAYRPFEGVMTSIGG